MEKKIISKRGPAITSGSFEIMMTLVNIYISNVDRIGIRMSRKCCEAVSKMAREATLKRCLRD